MSPKIQEKADKDKSILIYEYLIMMHYHPQVQQVQSAGEIVRLAVLSQTKCSMCKLSSGNGHSSTCNVGFDIEARVKVGPSTMNGELHAHVPA